MDGMGKKPFSTFSPYFFLPVHPTPSPSSGLPWHVPMPSKPCMLRGIALVSLGWITGGHLQVTKTPGWWISIMFIFHPEPWEKWCNLTNIFQIGWNHQLDTCCGVGMGWRNWFNTTILWSNEWQEKSNEMIKGAFPISGELYKRNHTSNWKAWKMIQTWCSPSINVGAKVIRIPGSGLKHEFHVAWECVKLLGSEDSIEKPWQKTLTSPLERAI